MAPQLNDIVSSQDSAQVDSKRLTTAQYIQTLTRMAKQLEVCAAGYQKLTDAVSPGEVRELLKGIMQGAKHVGDSAERLINANE